MTGVSDSYVDKFAPSPDEGGSYRLGLLHVRSQRHGTGRPCQRSDDERAAGAAVVRAMSSSPPAVSRDTLAGDALRAR
jgi:hypothetical protein